MSKGLNRVTSYNKLDGQLEVDLEDIESERQKYLKNTEVQADGGDPESQDVSD